MKGLTWSAPAVVLPSGRVLVGTGFCFLLLEDECGFLGHVRRRWCSALAVADELERRWSQSGSVVRPTDPPASIDQLEGVMGMPLVKIVEGLGELMGLERRKPGSS